MTRFLTIVFGILAVIPQPKPDPMVRTIVLQQSQDFPVARSFGCAELARTCRANERSARIEPWTIKTPGRTKAN